MRRLILTTILCAFAATPAFADLYGGDLMWDAAETEIVAGLTWDSITTKITWDVHPIDSDLDGDTDYFHYAYTFTAPSPGISHFILQVSSQFSVSELWNLTSPLIISGGQPVLYGPAPANPGIPGTIWGIKLEAYAAGIDMPSSWSFDSTRVPVWGDFYAKGGSNNYAYNSGFLVEPDVEFGHIAVPDTHNVPVPAAVLLGLLGLSVVHLKLRKCA